MAGDPVSEDAQLLISKFLERKSLEYTDFVEVWHSISFTHLLCIPNLLGDHLLENSNTTLVELMHRLLQVGAKHMCSTGGDERVKLAGLFMCHSIYFMQPLEVKVRIRVTVECWDQLNKLYTHLKESKLFQALYMLIALRDDAAFSICCTPSQMTLLSWAKDNPMNQYQACLPESSAELVSVQKDVAPLSIEYDEIKKELSMFLPNHLLEPSSLPDKLERVIECYPKCKNS